MKLSKSKNAIVFSYITNWFTYLKLLGRLSITDLGPQYILIIKLIDAYIYIAYETDPTIRKVPSNSLSFLIYKIPVLL